MPSDGARMVEGYRTVNAKVVERGGPPTSETMLAALESFWLSGCFRFVLRKGRQIGWSTVIVPRIVVTTALFGGFQQARGSRGVIGLSSTKLSEAGERLYNIESAFRDMGVKAKMRADTLEVPGRPVIVQSFPATSDAARGTNAWSWFEDELCAWRDGDGANPAKERDAAIAPACASHEEARIYSASTPMGMGDFHARLVALGDTQSQRVFCGATWHWRPDLSEARCRGLEPDEDQFSREFGAVPFDGSTSSLFSESALMKVTRPAPLIIPFNPEAEYVAFTDPAARANSWTLVIARRITEDSGMIVVQIVLHREWKPTRGGALDSESVFKEIADELHQYQVFELWSDQWAFDANKAIAARYDVDLLLEASTQSSKVQSFENLRRRVADCSVQLPDDRQIRDDLCAARKWISKGGAFTIELEKQGQRHADFAPAVAGCVWKAGISEAPNFMQMRKEYYDDRDDEDDGDRTSLLGPNVVKRIFKYDNKLCRMCQTFYPSGECPRHGVLQ